jgi:hypothetical protein
MQNITATFVDWTPPPLGAMAKWRKEDHFTGQTACLAIVNGKIETLIEARTYGTTAASYCCVWVHASDGWRHGGGRATGYGYHRYSAAMESALAVCGVKLSENIGGVGEQAMDEAIRAIARAMGHDDVTLSKAHP